MDKLTQLKEVIEKEINTYFENTDLFLVDIKVLTNGKIEVFADGKTNITIDECAKISKAMKVKTKLKKQLNKKVDVVLKNGLKITGELIEANEKEIVVKETIIIKKIETIEEHTFSFDEIKSVKKHFNFKL